MTMLKEKLGITEEFVSIDQILRWSVEEQTQLRKALHELIYSAFPKLSETAVSDRVQDYFRIPGSSFHRHAIFLKNAANTRIAATIFDVGEVKYKRHNYNGVYIISRVVLSEYQNAKLGQLMAANIVMTWGPDILLTTCGQSSSLYSWLGLTKKSLISGFTVYPQLEHRNGKPHITFLPQADREFVQVIFSQFYSGVVEGDRDQIDKAVKNLTSQMVRKGVYAERYDFAPWKRNAREDEIAKALALTDNDGVLVVLRKKSADKVV